MDQKQKIIQEIHRVANSISAQCLTKKAFLNSASISESKLRYHFGTWNSALETAGLEPNPPSVHVSGYETIPHEELLEEIGTLWKRVDRRPAEDLMNSIGKFSVTPYRSRWGTFSRAVDEYVRRFRSPSIIDVKEPEPQQKATSQRLSVVIPRTHKPKSDAKRQRHIVYGEPIDFRGLRYAPVNEQGVVYLFGMVSRELGFLIESIRTDLPDCEGKRCLNPEGSEWQHVRIEFENGSSNFMEHGHNPEGCDLIVCWIHDWDDCPLEVLELKTNIPFSVYN